MNVRVDTKTVRTTVVVPKEKKDFRCVKCDRMVDVKKAKPHTFETDDTIFKTWDYGHFHNKVFRIEGSKQYRVE